MPANQPKISVRKSIIAILVIVAAIMLKYAYITNSNFIIYIMLAVLIIVCIIFYQQIKA